MRRSSPWLFLVIALLGALILREPRLQRADDFFQAWAMENSAAPLPPSPVTLVEIGREDFRQMAPASATKTGPQSVAATRSLSPLEYALFLQAVLDFEPAVIGLEPIVIWRDRDQSQEQVFIDQAMRVPKLLVAMQLGEKGGRDLAAEDLPSFSQVTGPRGGLAQFSGISHRPDDDIRLISTPGFTNLPTDRSDRIRAPMLFEYRGEIVPSFPLQAIMLWLRATPADVQIVLGSQILLPNGWKIPLHRDGTTTINPVAAGSVRRLTLNQLLLAAQERGAQRHATVDLSGLKDQIVLFRINGDPLQPPNIFAATIATIQSNAYVLPAPWFYDWCVIGVLAVAALFVWRLSKAMAVMIALALSAAYLLTALGMLSQARVWLPMFLPLALLWILVLIRLVMRLPAPVPNE